MAKKTLQGYFIMYIFLVFNFLSVSNLIQYICFYVDFTPCILNSSKIASEKEVIFFVGWWGKHITAAQASVLNAAPKGFNAQHDANLLPHLSLYDSK